MPKSLTKSHIYEKFDQYLESYGWMILKKQRKEYSSVTEYIKDMDSLVEVIDSETPSSSLSKYDFEIIKKDLKQLKTEISHPINIPENNFTSSSYEGKITLTFYAIEKLYKHVFTSFGSVLLKNTEYRFLIISFYRTLVFLLNSISSKKEVVSAHMKDETHPERDEQIKDLDIMYNDTQCLRQYVLERFYHSFKKTTSRKKSSY